MQILVLAVIGALPLWLAVGWLSLDTRHLVKNGERQLRRRTYEHLSAVGNIMERELYDVKRVVEHNVLWTPEMALEVTSATPDDTELFAIRFPIMVLVDRLNRLAIAIDLEVFTIADVLDADGDDVVETFNVTKGFVLAMRERVPAAYSNYFNLLEYLDVAVVEHKAVKLNE